MLIQKNIYFFIFISPVILKRENRDGELSGLFQDACTRTYTHPHTQYIYMYI